MSKPVEEKRSVMTPRAFLSSLVDHLKETGFVKDAQLGGDIALTTVILDSGDRYNITAHKISGHDYVPATKSPKPMMKRKPKEAS